MDVDPIVNNWYQYVDSENSFVVIALDEGNNMVEIQHADGDVEEIPLESWYDLNLEPIETPEDWNGPDGHLDREDADYDDDDLEEEEDFDEEEEEDDEEEWEDEEDEEWEDEEDEDWDDDVEEEDWDDR